MTHSVMQHYDTLPYHSDPLAYTHPSRIATIGTLFGVNPPDVRTARILELACGDGRNLTAIASSLPNAQCVGIDLSNKHIEIGQQRLQQFGLNNIRLIQQDIKDFQVEAGSFDYIIVHGLYSWVAAEVRARVLTICQHALSEHGMAYISYNTLPGSHLRHTIRDLIQFYTRPVNDTTQQIAILRQTLHLLLQASSASQDAHSQLLASELQLFSQLSDSYLFHEFLELDNHAFYFHEFVETVQRYGLNYVGDIYLHSMLPNQLPEAAVQAVQQLSRDILYQEQQLDILRNRRFRHTLLCRQTVKLNRTLTPEQIKGLAIASSLSAKTDNPTQFSNAQGTIDTRHGFIQTALTLLQQNWPKAIPFNQVVELTRQAYPESNADDIEHLASTLLRAYTAGLIEANVLASGFVVTVSDAPKVLPLAREEAKIARQVTNLRCELVNIENVIAHKLLPHLTGERTRAQLLDLVHEWLQQGEIQLNFQSPDGTQAQIQLNVQQQRDILKTILDEALYLIAKAALLIE
ncbi:methyltransferase regulatory domain-containing protein [Thioflexithrix psekupsensis]|uniref:Methyltransferase domain-containing protein n=1 Tax=Thioflexithrix psekupsensis TaxID=1570016 RepID=A0A251X937_9GAMM|nr:class I SAM-dependent methyltransferase [Thioflexithrix psekupsensis]OUD14491.1 hypothetical protein TPSD3_09320 [Thioflexithrix psekupsensis]